MPVRATGGTLILVGALVAAGAAFAPGAADAARTTPAAHAGGAPDAAAVRAAVRAVQAGMTQGGRGAIHAPQRRAGRPASGRLQCVPFARENSGIELIGDARTWWGKATGVYERGTRPEVGSVLTFRATRRMPLGHVAVVTKIVDGRTVEIDHANWTSAGLITRAVSVVDVSDRNDWGAVRVEVGQSGDYGAIYPAHGFIYDRPDRGTMVANTSFAPMRVLPPAALDHRLPRERQDAQPYEEVAEAPDDGAPSVRRRTARARAAVSRSSTGPIYMTIEPASAPWARAVRPIRDR